MNAQNWSETLRLLCMMILVDEKIDQEKIDAFKQAALALRDMVNPKLMLTEQMAEDWFMLHQDDIAISVSRVFYESSIAKSLKNLNAVANKKELIFALLKVAMSDGVKHKSEDDLVQSARKTWNLDIRLAS